MLGTILSVVLAALMPVGTMPSSGPHGGPAPLGGGGPDVYGYKYLDSDTTAPGAPTYKWVSIKGVGTKITTLLDDNTAGPFPIGFSFPYYWYRVDSVIVGSNGYITFGDTTKSQQPFKSVPSTNRPNDQLAPLLSDLDCTDTASVNGSVWYWTNAAADTFIVEYDSIAFWSAGGNNTFQIILTKADSSITFQYQQQSGTPSNGWAGENAQVGIEDAVGSIGLNYLSGTNPARNAIHDSLAVRFIPPESAKVHDVGVRNAMNDRNGGVFAVKTRPLSFWAVVKNYGTQAEAGYETYFEVQRPNGSVVFSDSMLAQASSPGQTESLALADEWRPSTNGTYVIKVFTKLVGDMVPMDDTATVELHVVTMPATLTYDSGTPVHTWYFYQAGNGWGNRFVPPVYPCSVQSIRLFMSMITAPSKPFVGIFDDKGPGGGPGDTLFDTTVTDSATSPGSWYTVTLPSPVVIDSGAFYVGAISVVDSECAFGMDSVPPLSNQRWECTAGSWASSNDPSQGDFMANATISGPVGIFETTQPALTKVPMRIDVSPNPFGGMTSIRLLNARGLEKTIEIYDATGSVVRTLGVSRDQAVLDGRHLAGGIYFARVVGAEAPVAKVIVTH